MRSAQGLALGGDISGGSPIAAFGGDRRG